MVTNPTTPSETDGELRKKIIATLKQYAPHETAQTRLHGGIVDWQMTLTKDGLDSLAGAISGLFRQELAGRERETQTNAVAWTIGVIDDIHMNDHRQIQSDSIYKGIKNTIRDRYKSEIGVDPAPTYPIKAQLSHRKGEDNGTTLS